MSTAVLARSIDRSCPALFFRYALRASIALRMIGTTPAAIAPARGILLPALDRSLDDDWKKAVGKTKDA